jgi:glycosyltransferase involved in cell wall biosynthesis
MKILLLSRYERLGASSRYRTYQYIPALQERGHEVTVSPLLSDKYLRSLYARRAMPLLDVARSYVRRIASLRSVAQYDLVWIEYEALPWIPAWIEEKLLGGQTPYVVDYDDAVFHRYDLHAFFSVRRILGEKIDRVMRHAVTVIAGNEYLADRARKAGARRIAEIPTVIDLARYPNASQPENQTFTIGWIGSPATSHYLSTIQDALRSVSASGRCRMLAVGDTALKLDGVPLETVPWDEGTEIDEMLRFDVGIMPLLDSPWERGKCGHKLIQYMGCCRAVVASPVGINRIIVQDGVNGFLAADISGWVESLNRLRADSGLRRRMGLAGRRKVESQYSLQVTAPRMTALFEEIVRS